MLGTVFNDRRDAGRKLGEALDRFGGRPDAAVFALARGGVPVGFEVARRLGLPLDVAVAARLSVPGHEEQAFGVVANGSVVLFENVLREEGDLDEAAVASVLDREFAALERREASYRNGRPAVDPTGTTAIVVDDGAAYDGALAAVARGLRSRGASEVVIAVPVASPAALERLAREADDAACLSAPDPFFGVSFCYYEYARVSDDEVRELLRACDPTAPA